MRVYVETGILIDYLAQGPFAMLRATTRRGRDPARLLADATEVLQEISARHEGAASAFACYEAEEALYRLIRVSLQGQPHAAAARLTAARPILGQALTAARFFGLTVLPLVEDAVEALARADELVNHRVRAADGLHLMAAAAFDADLVLSADADLLRVDRLVRNRSGRPMHCCDTNVAMTALR
ncbi:MAG TPA: hypothetical protein VGG99_00375 [Acetobacteraceae bacterium]